MGEVVELTDDIVCRLTRSDLADGVRGGGI